MDVPFVLALSQWKYIACPFVRLTAEKMSSSIYVLFAVQKATENSMFVLIKEKSPFWRENIYIEAKLKLIVHDIIVHLRWATFEIVYFSSKLRTSWYWYV